jgi:hypothetical protein
MTEYIYSSHVLLNYFPAGCYRFSDGSFLKYLNHSTTEPNNHKLRISAPIFKNHDECELSNYFTHHRDNDTGESKTVDVFSFNKEDETIEVDGNKHQN